MTLLSLTTLSGASAWSVVLSLRLAALAALVALLTAHVRSVRVFRWERVVSGGVLVTYCIAVLGLALCAGALKCGSIVLQAYLCGSGGILLALNAGVLYRRWASAGELTHAVAELLDALGVPLRRQILTKVILSGIAAVILITDLALGVLST